MTGAYYLEMYERTYFSRCLVTNHRVWVFMSRVIHNILDDIALYERGDDHDYDVRDADQPHTLGGYLLCLCQLKKQFISDKNIWWKQYYTYIMIHGVHMVGIWYIDVYNYNTYSISYFEVVDRHTKFSLLMYITSFLFLINN